MKDPLFNFSWQRFPALFLFLSLLSGALLSLGIFFPFLIAFTHPKKSFIIGFISLSLFTASIYTYFTTTPPESGFVTAYIEPISIKNKRNKILLTAKAPYLYTENGKSHQNVKVFLSFSQKNLPSMQHSHIVYGYLKKTAYGYFLQPKQCIQDKYFLSLINLRHRLHKKATKFIHKRVKDKDVQNYFTSLVTGTIPSTFLREKFSSSGMIHILAISGFHFTWILFLLSIPLSLLFPQKKALLLLLLCAWFYFLFVGNSISMSRAWMATSIYIISILFSKVRLPLNSLGIAGIFSILIDPYSIFHLSFALSFLATFAILTLFPLVKMITNYLFPKRPPNIFSMMKYKDKMVYTCNRFFSSSFFLSFFIQILILPISFLFFPYLSLWGLFYNTFFPITMIPTLILLMSGFLLSTLSSFSFLWKINEALSKPFLESLLYGKGSAFLLLKTPSISPQIIALISTLLIVLCLKIDAIFHEKYLLQQDNI